jgi:hypothetical protein
MYQFLKHLKDYAHPITGHEGLKGEQRYSCTLSLTLAVDWGSRSTTPWPLDLRETDPVFIVQEAGWAPGLVWTGAENTAPPPRLST